MMNRREMIVGASAVPFIGVASAAAAHPRDPHPEWLKAWKVLTDKHGEETLNPSEEQAVWDEREVYAVALANTKATTTEGLAAQFEWFKDDLGQHVEEMFGDDFINVLDVIGAGFGELV